MLEQSDSVALFLVEQFKTSDYFAMLAEVCPELAVCRAGPACAPRTFPSCAGSWRSRSEAPAGGITWDEMLHRAAIGAA